MTAIAAEVSPKRTSGRSRWRAAANVRRARKLGRKTRPADSNNIFRWYRSGWGRFTTADPYGVGGGSMSALNLLYGYAQDNPTKNTDPLGLYSVDPPGGTQAADVNQAVFQIMQKLNSPGACCGPLAREVKRVLSDPQLQFKIAPWLQGCGFTPGAVIDGVKTIYIGTKAWGQGCCYNGTAGLNGLASTILHELVHQALQDPSEPLPTWAEKKCFGCQTPPPPPPPVMHYPPAGRPWW